MSPESLGLWIDAIASRSDALLAIAFGILSIYQRYRELDREQDRLDANYVTDTTTSGGGTKQSGSVMGSNPDGRHTCIPSAQNPPGTPGP